MESVYILKINITKRVHWTILCVLTPCHWPVGRYFCKTNSICVFRSFRSLNTRNYFQWQLIIDYVPHLCIALQTYYTLQNRDLDITLYKSCFSPTLKNRKDLWAHFYSWDNREVVSDILDFRPLFLLFLLEICCGKKSEFIEIKPRIGRQLVLNKFINST